MGRFITISVEPARLDVAAAKAVVRACPVDIFTLQAGQLATDESREDECILCGRCVALASDAVSVTRAYGTRRPIVATAEGHD
jgi:ferredoxin-like protein FixX